MFYIYTPHIHTRSKWKSMENSAPDCNGHFVISVSSFTMIHIKKWTIWQSYRRKEKWCLKSFWSFSRNFFQLHTQCISSQMPVHLKDLHSGPTFELQLKVNTRWCNWISYSCRGDKPYSVCCCSIGAPSHYTQQLWPLGLFVRISRKLPVKSRWIVVGDGQLACNSDNAIWEPIYSGLDTDGSVAVVEDGWRNWCTMK